jgi:hypothetical protein
MLQKNETTSLFEIYSSKNHKKAEENSIQSLRQKLP